MYFDTNFPPGFMGSTLTSFDIDANNDDETLTVAATVSIPTTFVRMFGYGDVPVSASAEVVRKQTALDVVMAIDISGSMGWSAPGGGSRIDAAKQAAEDLVDILFGDDATKPFLNIGLVPWNAKVNVMTDGDPYNPGSTTTESVAAFINPETGASQNELYYANNSHVPLLSFPPPNWRGCVFSRYLSGLPADGQADIEKEPYSGGGVDWMGWQPIFPGEHTQWGGEPKWGGVCELSVGGEECADCSSSRILPLTNVKSEVLDAIDGLGSSGNTNIPAGLGWAWRVLTPEPPLPRPCSILITTANKPSCCLPTARIAPPLAMATERYSDYVAGAAVATPWTNACACCPPTSRPTGYASMSSNSPTKAANCKHSSKRSPAVPTRPITTTHRAETACSWRSTKSPITSHSLG